MEMFGGGWFWLAFAIVLFGLEAMAPGAFMLWFGLAALAMLPVVLALDLPLPVQWVVFGVLALLAAVVGWRYRRRRPPLDSDRPLLNQRGRQFVGEVHPLETAIVNGRGRLKIGDTFWTVEGDNAPAGTPVRIIGSDGMTLLVTRADPAHAHLSPASGLDSA